METMNIANRVGLSLGAFYPQGFPAGITLPQPDGYLERPNPLRAFSLDSTSSFSDMDEQGTAANTQERSQRSRRRLQPGVQLVKHRRTRSGCYTCRQRRIKCDETRPTCERCRKGKRECNYPGAPTTNRPPSRTSPKSQSKSPSNEAGSEQSEADLEDLTPELTLLTEIPNVTTIVDPMKTPATTTTAISHEGSPTSNDATTSPTATITSLPSIHSSKPQYGVRHDSHQSANIGLAQSSRWLALSSDVRFLLTYHRDNLTHHHYSFRHDRNDFLKTTFLEAAVNDDSEALLYAVVAFSSYHYTLACGDAAISNFLSYYNKSIILLSQRLTRRRSDITTLLTILQLATIEECLGDWMNMRAHQKAAYQIIIEMFTPQTVVRDDTSLRIIQWYTRFDLFHALLSGTELNLARGYITAYRDFYRKRVESGLCDIAAKVDELSATLQLLAAELSALISAERESYSNRGSVHNELGRRFAEYREDLETISSTLSETEQAEMNSSFYHESLDIGYGTTLSQKRELSCVKYLHLDFMSLDLMMKHGLERYTPTELAAQSLKIATMLDAMEQPEYSSPSGMLNCRGSLATVSYFLPRKSQYINWARRKFAAIERLGCIYPAPLRRRVLALWCVDENEMWLPNDECSSPVLESVRDFIQYRASVQYDAPSTSTIPFYFG